MKIEEHWIKVRGDGDVKQLVDINSGKALRRIIAGLGWPYAEKPGFVIVMGEDFDQDHTLPHSPRHFRILAEHETADLEELQRMNNQFCEDYGLNSIRGNPENPVYEVWRQNRTDGSLINVTLPTDYEKIDINLIAQLVRRNTEGRKTLHFRESKIPGYLTRFQSERIENEAIEQYPPMAAFGFVLAEMELRGDFSNLGFQPDRSKIVFRNRRRWR